MGRSSEQSRERWASSASPGPEADKQLIAQSHPHKRNHGETAFTNSKTRFYQLGYELPSSTYVKNDFFYFAEKLNLFSSSKLFKVLCNTIAGTATRNGYYVSAENPCVHLTMQSDGDHHLGTSVI